MLLLAVLGIFIIEKRLLYIRIGSVGYMGVEFMSIKIKNLMIQILSFLGFILTIKLAMIFYVANYEKYALSSFCSINSFIDCDGAARTTSAQFWGIPLAYWGMFYYIVILFLTFVDKLKNIKYLKFLEVFKNPMSYIGVISLAAFCISIILAWISVFRINKLCILCVATYFIDLAIAVTASDYIIDDFKNTILDFISGVKKYTKTFVVLVILASSFLLYSGTTYTFVPHIKRIKHFQKYTKMKHNPYKVEGNVLGSENAEIVIDLYSDYVCPLCYIHNIMLHKAVKEFSNIKVVHHNYPFDKECNLYITTNMHPNACIMAKAALAAKKQNNYWGMSSLLYENRPTNKENIMKLADELNFDKERFESDFDSAETYKELKKEIDSAYNKNIDSTPTMIINGKKKVGIMTYDELRDYLIQNGAKKR